MNAVQNRKLSKAYSAEIDSAYRAYYAERHAMEDANVDPNEWELQLWEKWELTFIEIYVRHSC